MKPLTGLAALALSTIALVPISCDEGAIDCFRICDRYSECVTDIDVTECADLCEDRTDASEDIEARASACEICVDNDRACAEVEGCWSDCPVVPVAD